MKKQCAVCGDTCETNVRLVWQRDSDGALFNVCCACAENHKVDAVSVDNFKTKYTVGHINTTARLERPSGLLALRAHAMNPRRG